MSREIPATQGFAAIVDDDDFERLSAHKWYAHNNAKKAKRPARRTSVTEGRKVILMHHDIMRPPAGFVIDHINGDPWDNRKANLRLATHAENIRNQRRKMRGDCPKGVSLYRGKYLARLSVDRRLIYLGRFDNPVAAGLAYDTAALRYHGEFASLNYPTPKEAAAA